MQLSLDFVEYRVEVLIDSKTFGCYPHCGCPGKYWLAGIHPDDLMFGKPYNYEDSPFSTEFACLFPRVWEYY